MASTNQASKDRSGFIWQLLENRKASVGAALILFFVLLGLLGPVLLRRDPSDFVGPPHQPPSSEYLLGTTGQGQDVFAQVVAGARTSLLVGFLTGFAVMAIGALVGMAAGFFGGWIDSVLSFITNVFLIMPGLPLAVVIAAYLKPGPVTIGLVLVITGWAWNARMLRSQILSLREKDFVLAAIVSGEGRFRIIFREILPNMTSLLMSGFISATVYAIGAQVGLEFLGIGDLSVVTWGTNLYWAANDAALLTGAWWTVVPTGLCVALIGFALVLVNFAIDEITNPRLRSERTWAKLRKRHDLEEGLSTPVVRPSGN
ncbi:ABC transporter permease [Hyalangium rubrum]|uniref:ABC transporter permease n=1 Tax=Hyalangium rubrum TaxID=3103134 RepID=A0ABU5HC40_9BACT|nr:ABC transporter permease [Hyalangium sp. s54d21]MDY7229660.1 ABC transporter permease [Hyalangium sp. s54d21]